ncbi:MAG: sensor signal transduction histidine kinase [Marmoricola sp.]|nr:sensor signal transduction histidine kinase [Marmoricola sp.]
MHGEAPAPPHPRRGTAADDTGTRTGTGRRAASHVLAQVVLLLLVVGLLALPHLLPGTAYAGWPSIGFAVALLLRAPRPERWWTWAALTLAATPAVSLSYQVPVGLGLVGATVLSLSALFVATHLLGGRHTGPGRLVEIDGARFLLVTLAGAALNSVLPAAMALVAQAPLRALAVSVTTVVAVLTAQLVVLPVFLRTTDRPATAGPLERWSQRLVLLAVFVGVFWLSSASALAFLVLPVVAWAAVRATQRETHLQVFVVGLAAYALTVAGAGPFVDPTPTRLPVGLDSAQVYLFLLALCYGTVPLALTVDRLFTMTREATRVATTVEQLLDSAGGTMFIASDAQGRITHYNTGAERLLGYPAEAMLGRSPRLFHTAREIARHAADMGVADDYVTVVREMVRRGEQRDWEFVHLDGTRKMTSLTLSTTRDAEGRLTGFIATGEDVTERLRAQRALMAALDLEHASVVRLEEVDQVKQELVSNVSHELRTPITSISGYVELLRDGTLGDLSSEQRDAVRRISRNTGRLGLLVEDLLTLSRAESGGLDLQARRVDLREVVRESLDLLAETIADRDLRIDPDLPGSPVLVPGDADALERVVTNLLTNAVKFTPDGGHVRLCLTREGGEGSPAAVLRVSDSGIGIPPEDQEQLFTRFFRARGATDRAIQGTGLGLSIVHSIVTQHGGTVAVESSPGVGTTMTVRLPAYAERPQQA